MSAGARVATRTWVLPDGSRVGTARLVRDEVGGREYVLVPVQVPGRGHIELRVALGVDEAIARALTWRPTQTVNLEVDNRGEGDPWWSCWCHVCADGQDYDSRAAAEDSARAHAVNEHPGAVAHVWVRTGPSTYEAASGWELKHHDSSETGGDIPGPGWYLYGPRQFPTRRMVKEHVPPMAMDFAATVIAQHERACSAGGGA